MQWPCRNNQLFWTSVYNNSLFIWRSNLHNGSDAVPLIDTGASTSHYQYGQQKQWFYISLAVNSVLWHCMLRIMNTVSIAVDWIADKIYWTNNSQIMVYDLHNGYVTTVINSTEPGTLFHQVVVDPGTRLVLIFLIYKFYICYTYFHTVHSTGVM